jgi:hypothetical protein
VHPDARYTSICALLGSSGSGQPEVSHSAGLGQPLDQSHVATQAGTSPASPLVGSAGLHMDTFADMPLFSMQIGVSPSPSLTPISKFVMRAVSQP